jgi:hypothetical protein
LVIFATNNRNTEGHLDVDVAASGFTRESREEFERLAEEHPLAGRLLGSTGRRRDLTLRV